MATNTTDISIIIKSINLRYLSVFSSAFHDLRAIYIPHFNLGQASASRCWGMGKLLPEKILLKPWHPSIYSLHHFIDICIITLSLLHMHCCCILIKKFSFSTKPTRKTKKSISKCYNTLLSSSSTITIIVFFTEHFSSSIHIIFFANP